MAGLGHDDEDLGEDPVGLSHHDEHSNTNSDAIDYTKNRSPSIPELQEGAGSMTDEESPYRTVPATQSQLAPHEDQPYSPRSQEGSMTGSETSCEGFTRHNYKVIVIGDANSGKTSFIRRYVDGVYSSDVTTTIGVDYSLKTITIRQLKMVILLQIWDIAGQDRNRTMVRPFFNDAVGAIIMADCTRMGDEGQFQSEWKQDLDQKVSLPDGRQLPVVLVANKSDLLEDAQVEQLEVRCEQIAQEQGYCSAVVASAKDDVNVENAVYLLVQELVRLQEAIDRPAPQQYNTVGLTVGEFTALKQRGHVPQREPQQCGC